MIPSFDGKRKMHLSFEFDATESELHKFVTQLSVLLRPFAVEIAQNHFESPVVYVTEDNFESPPTADRN